MKPLETPVLPSGIRSRFVDEINGLKVHILEAGFDAPGRQLVLMLHGFPEIAYSWRKVMPALAAAGYHVVAPDLRGYGRTTGWAGPHADTHRVCASDPLPRPKRGALACAAASIAACSFSGRLENSRSAAARRKRS